MKKFFPVLFAVCMLGSASAAAADNLKIGYLVTPKLMQESKVGKEAQGKLKKRLEEAQKALDAKLQSVKKLEADIDKKMAVLNDDEKKKLSDEYERQMRDAKRMKEDYQRELSKVEAEIMGDLQRKLRGVIEKFAKEGGYDLILDAGQALYISDKGKGDVTAEIITLADKAQ